MPYPVTPNHPKQKLLFYVSQTVNNEVTAEIRNFVISLASLRNWVNGPPKFVNNRQEEPALSSVDMPIETLGGYLEIYSALPPLSLPREIDLQHLDEVTTLIEATSEFSRNHNITFEFELDGTYVGVIRNGTMDRSLSEGLLGQWRQHLGV